MEYVYNSIEMTCGEWAGKKISSRITYVLVFYLSVEPEYAGLWKLLKPETAGFET